jgi:hypothetical protein
MRLGGEDEEGEEGEEEEEWRGRIRGGAGGKDWQRQQNGLGR